jgi:hypothetical protein
LHLDQSTPLVSQFALPQTFKLSGFPEHGTVVGDGQASSAMPALIPTACISAATTQIFKVLICFISSLFFVLQQKPPCIKRRREVRNYFVLR